MFVVDAGTFRAAATALGTTQPNISARISSLESALNTTLLIRDAGSVRLTAKGEALLAKTRKVLWAGETLIEEAGRQELIEERLRLGVTELVACTWLRDFLRRLKDAYPNLRVELQVDLSTVIDQRLSEGQIDLAFQTEPFKSSMFASIPLGVENYCWVAHPEVLCGMWQNPTMADLFQHIVLSHAKYTQAGESLHKKAKDLGLDVGQIVHSSALSACVPMVLEGLGIALLPEALVRSEVATGDLCTVHADWLPPPLSFFGRYAESRTPLFVGKAAEMAADIMRASRMNDKFDLST